MMSKRICLIGEMMAMLSGLRAAGAKVASTTNDRADALAKALKRMSLQAADLPAGSAGQAAHAAGSGAVAERAAEEVPGLIVANWVKTKTWSALA